MDQPGQGDTLHGCQEGAGQVAAGRERTGRGQEEAIKEEEKPRNTRNTRKEDKEQEGALFTFLPFFRVFRVFRGFSSSVFPRRMHPCRDELLCFSRSGPYWGCRFQFSRSGLRTRRGRTCCS